MEFQTHTLPNGIRIIHSQVEHSLVSHLGLFVNAGSRDEEASEQGIAHYIEHTLFKGTQKRKAFHILNRLDSVGGDLNAYTTKEYTCIYASVLNAHYTRALELIADIAFQSTFPEKEIRKEKEVIIDEINSYLDAPSEQIFDDFEEQAFAGHSIGRNILGTVDHVKGFQRKDVLSFIGKHYSTNQIVLSSVSGLPMSKVIRLAEKYIGSVPASTSAPERVPYNVYKPQHVTIEREAHQAHYMLGGIGYSAPNPKRRGLVLLNNILGGPAMNSRLNLSIRERAGLTYNIESNYAAYSDTGLFSIYLGTDPQYLNRSIKLTKKELKLLRTKKLGTVQLHNAQQQLIGQIALASENKSNPMVSLGRSLLLYDRVDTIENIYEKITAITASELLEIANEVFDDSVLSSLTYLPAN